MEIMMVLVTTRVVLHPNSIYWKVAWQSNTELDCPRVAYSPIEEPDVKIITLLIRRWLLAVGCYDVVFIDVVMFPFPLSRKQWGLALYPSQYQHAHILNINIALWLALTQPIPGIFWQNLAKYFHAISHPSYVNRIDYGHRVNVR